MNNSIGGAVSECYYYYYYYYYDDVKNLTYDKVVVVGLKDLH